MIPSDKEFINIYHNTKGMRRLRIAEAKNGLGVSVFHVEQEVVEWFGFVKKWYKVEGHVGCLSNDEFSKLEQAEEYMVEIIVYKLRNLRHTPHAYHMYVS